MFISFRVRAELRQPALVNLGLNCLYHFKAICMEYHSILTGYIKKNIERTQYHQEMLFYIKQLARTILKIIDSVNGQKTVANSTW